MASLLFPLSNFLIHAFTIQLTSFGSDQLDRLILYFHIIVQSYTFHYSFNTETSP